MNLKKKKRKKILVLFYAIFLVCAFIFGKSISVFAEEIDPVQPFDESYRIGDFIATGTVTQDVMSCLFIYEMQDDTFSETANDSTYTIKDANRNIKLWKVKDLRHYIGLTKVHLVAVTDYSHTDPKDQTVTPEEQAIMKTEVNTQRVPLSYEWFQKKKMVEPAENYMQDIGEYTKNNDGSINFDVGRSSITFSLHFPHLRWATLFLTAYPKGDSHFYLRSTKTDTDPVEYESFYWNSGPGPEKSFTYNFVPTRKWGGSMTNVTVKNLKVIGEEDVSTGVTSNILKLSSQENEEFFKDGNEFFCRITTGDGESYETNLATLNIIDKPSPEPEKDNQGSISNPDTSATIFMAIIIAVIVIGLSGFVIYQKRKKNL